jgi:hypothetical protein
MGKLLVVGGLIVAGIGMLVMLGVPIGRLAGAPEAVGGTEERF